MDVKAIARGIVRHPLIGRPCADVLGRMGEVQRRERVLDLCGYMPRTFKVNIPLQFEPHASFLLARGDEVDQIAWRLWKGGWSGFERPVPDLFAICARKAKEVFDVGANSGLYSLIAASVNPQGHVHAFEPLPSALAFLRRNVDINRFTERVQIVDAAVAESDGHADFFVPSGNEGLLEMSASLNSTFRANHSSVLRVPLVTLDSYAHQHGLDRIDLIKVDVESQEHRVLAGAAEIMAEHRPVVFLEVLPGADASGLEAIRRRLDYQTFAPRLTAVVQLAGVASDEEAVNQIFWPSERVDELEGVARAAGLALTRRAKAAATIDAKPRADLQPSRAQ